MKYLLLSLLCFVMVGCMNEKNESTIPPVEPKFGYICLLDYANRPTHKWLSISNIFITDSEVEFLDMYTDEWVTISNGVVLISKIDPCPEIQSKY